MWQCSKIKPFWEEVKKAIYKNILKGDVLYILKGYVYTSV